MAQFYVPVVLASAIGGWIYPTEPPVYIVGDHLNDQIPVSSWEDPIMLEFAVAGRQGDEQPPGRLEFAGNRAWGPFTGYVPRIEPGAHVDVTVELYPRARHRRGSMGMLMEKIELRYIQDSALPVKKAYKPLIVTLPLSLWRGCLTLKNPIYNVRNGDPVNVLVAGLAGSGKSSTINRISSVMGFGEPTVVGGGLQHNTVRLRTVPLGGVANLVDVWGIDSETFPSGLLRKLAEGHVAEGAHMNSDLESISSSGPERKPADAVVIVMNLAALTELSPVRRNLVRKYIEEVAELSPILVVNMIDKVAEFSWYHASEQEQGEWLDRIRRDASEQFNGIPYGRVVPHIARPLMSSEEFQFQDGKLTYELIHSLLSSPKR